MGFLDKAKKMAEQAQTKLDEVQQEFNKGQPSGNRPSGAAVEYDQHGRPIRDEAPPQAPEAPQAQPAEPPAPAAERTPPHGDPLGQQPAPERKEDDPYAPPKLTGGDPLAG